MARPHYDDEPNMKAQTPQIPNQIERLESEVAKLQEICRDRDRELLTIYRAFFRRTAEDSAAELRRY